MTDFNIYLTQENLDAIQQELAILEGETRAKAITEVTIARGHGDLSENFEYQAARSELERINRRIADLKRVLIYAKTITEVATDSVDVGTCFIATSIRNGAVATNIYKLVGYVNLSMMNQVIDDKSKPIPVSVNSPFGKAIRDKKAGDAYAYIDVDHNQVTGEVVSIVSEIEVKPTADKTYTI